MVRSGRAIKKEKHELAREAALERSRENQQRRKNGVKKTEEKRGGKKNAQQQQQQEKEGNGGGAARRTESELGASSSPAAVSALACPIGGGLAGGGSGMLGSAIGLLKGAIRKEAGLSRLASSWKSSKSMAKTFAVFSGVYSIAGCYAKMLNGGVDNTLTVTGAGCVTGLAVSYASGPVEAFKSCAVLAAFSYFFDSSSTQVPTTNDTDETSSTTALTTVE